MTQPESLEDANYSEEANHFEQVLGRLDALLKRRQPASVLPAELADGDLPVLSEIYEGDIASTVPANAENLPAPLLTEAVGEPGHDTEYPIEQSFDSAMDQVPGQSLEQTAEQTISPAPESAQLPDAYFSSLATVSPDEALQPSVAIPAFDGAALVEKTLTTLMPLLQETVSAIVGEEIERALGEVRTEMARRLHGEIHDEIERVLRERLREALTDGAVNPEPESD